MRVKHYVIILASFSLTILHAAPVVNADSDNANESALVTASANSAPTESGLQLLTKINALQQQVENLQGQNDVLRHQLKQMQESQQRNYVSIDQRITALENTNKTVSSASTAPSIKTINADLGDDQAAYQQTYQLITSRQYSDALIALGQFVKQYPKSDLVPNALYWQGQIAAVQNDTVAANKSFNQLITQYPTHAKVPDAKLKLALMLADAGKKQEAIQQLNALIKQYPDAAAADTAKQQLKLWQTQKN